jgi:hypothetical protein
MKGQSLTAAAELNACYFDMPVSMAITPPVSDRFATAPILTAAPTYQPLNEEELHTSFERAISDRLLVINKRLSLRSSSLSMQGLEPQRESLGQLSAPGSMLDALPTTAPLQEESAKLLPGLARHSWLRGIIFGGLALMMMLIGFDLMGLLVLYMR